MVVMAVRYSDSIVIVVVVVFVRVVLSYGSSGGRSLNNIFVLITLTILLTNWCHLGCVKY